MKQVGVANVKLSNNPYYQYKSRPMKKLLMILMMSAFCFSASAIDVPQQDTTKTSKDSTKKQMKKKPTSKTKSMKKKSSSKKDSLKNKDNRTDTTMRPMQK